MTHACRLRLHLGNGTEWKEAGSTTGSSPNRPAYRCWYPSRNIRRPQGGNDLSDRIVRLHYEGGSAEIHCPACGKPIFESEGKKTLCAHVLFSYFDLPKIFGFVKEELKESAKAAQDYSDLWGANPV